jgi:aspartate aminotransferase-like enzyme
VTGDEILVLVDGVTSVGGTEFRTDAWGLDFALTGSQKALALPPGLAFGCATARMLARAATLPGRGQYFDLLEFDRYWHKFQTPTTPALSLIYALLEQLRSIEQETLEARTERHLGMARRCWEWIETAGSRWGMSVLAPVGARSPTITTIRVPASLTGTEVAARMKRRGYVIGSGYGKLKDATFRIGHMGDHSLESLNELLNVLEEALGE